MTFLKNPGRRLGLFYLLVSIPGAFALVYVPRKLIVHANPSATAANIAASETLFRAGIACNIIMEILFVLVVLALYDMFKRFNQRYAALMLGLMAVALPIALVNELNSLAALILIHGPAFLTAFDQPQREALAMLFLNLHSHGFDIAEIFWGLWLFPLGILVYRSRLLPRILGVLLILNCFSYLANSFTSLLLPRYEDLVSRIMKPLSFGELIFMFWILIMGIKQPPPTADSPALAA